MSKKLKAGKITPKKNRKGGDFISTYNNTIIFIFYIRNHEGNKQE